MTSRLAAGSLLADRYRLEQLIGEGGMGEVWAATHAVTGRQVAIKRLRASSRDLAERRARERFIREAQAACAVDHPNVVEILDFLDSGEEAPSLVMELLRGETLADRLAREQGLSLEDTAGILLQVVSAVGTAHARGIIHRDLKPANIFLQSDGDEVSVKVLDFGIAKWMAPGVDTQSLKTETGSTLGTPCYMAPEQAMAERHIDHRADVWALGVIAYECLSGARPIEGENAARMMVRLLSTGIIPIERLMPELPEAISSLVGRMLSREPDRRPADLREVLEVLSRFTSRRVPAFGAPEAAIAAATPVESPPDRPRKPRPRRLAWALAAGGVAAVVVGAVLLSRSEPRLATVMVSDSRPSELGVAPSKRPETTPLATGSAVTVATVEAPPPNAKPRRASRPAGTAPAAVKSAPAPAADPLPSGAACERSRDCASRVCLAFTCR